MRKIIYQGRGAGRVTGFTRIVSNGTLDKLSIKTTRRLALPTVRSRATGQIELPVSHYTNYLAEYGASNVI